MADVNEDLQEQEVWDVVEQKKNSSSKVRKNKENPSGSSSAWHFSRASRVLPRGKSGSYEDNMAQKSSAPVNIPDWSKIYNGENIEYVDDVEKYVDDDGDGDGDDMVPPHEYIARRLARTQIASFSMCEGIGRTLKGRDLSKLRNAILTKTGFLE